MKNILILLCAGLLMSSAVDAQTRKSKSKVKVKTTKAALISVPEVVKTNFQTKYMSSTNYSWSKAHGNYVVNFVNADGQKETAEYAAEGNKIFIPIRDQKIAAQIVKLPFYKK